MLSATPAFEMSMGVVLVSAPVATDWLVLSLKIYIIFVKFEENFFIRWSVGNNIWNRLYSYTPYNLSPKTYPYCIPCDCNEFGIYYMHYTSR